MILINLKALMERKSALEGRRITYKDVEEGTGIRRLTLVRIATNTKYNIKRKDIEKLLVYFGCQLTDLMTYIPDKSVKKT